MRGAYGRMTAALLHKWRLATSLGREVMRLWGTEESNF